MELEKKFWGFFLNPHGAKQPAFSQTARQEEEAPGLRHVAVPPAHRSVYLLEPQERLPSPPRSMRWRPALTLPASRRTGRSQPASGT